MYVDDALGSDSNDCLSPGAGACKTIQVAIDRLVSTTTVTSTINVAAGIYTEENVVIDKALRLQGAGITTKIAPADGDGIEINASSVTVDGFSIEPLHSGGDGFGIDVSGAVTTTNVTISNNVITTVRAGSSGTKGIFVSNGPTTALTLTGNTISVTSSNPGFESVSSAVPHSGWTITDNTFTDHTGTNLDLNDVDVLTVDGNTFGVSSGSSSVSIDSVSSLLSGPVSFTNNDVKGSTGGRMVSILAAVGIDNVAVRGNKFDGWATAAVRFGLGVTTTDATLNGFMQPGGLALENDNPNATVDASGSWWATVEETFIDTTSTEGLVDFNPFLASGTDTDSAPGFQGDYSSLYVTTLGEQAGTVGRIQRAVNLVTGSTISVLPGTYSSANAVLINEPNLTLRSTGGSGTTSTPITLITRNSAAGPVISVSSAAGGLTIGGAVGEGFVIAAHANATSTTIIDIVGVASPDDVTISHNVFDSTGAASTGILFISSGPSDNLVVNDNVFYLNSATSTGEDIGIDVSNMRDLQIMNNSFYGDANVPGATSWGGAVVSHVGARSTISDNTIDRVHTGIYVSEASDLVISGNTITHVSNGIHLDSEDTNNVIDNNDVTNSSAFGAGDNGINLVAGPSDTASNNYVENFAFGIRVDLDIGDNGVSVVDNTIIETDNGIWVSSISPFQNLTITGNDLWNSAPTSTTWGIYVNNGDGISQATLNTISNNTTTNFGYGIYTYDLSQSVIDGNAVYESMEAIAVAAGGSTSWENVVTNNTVENSGVQGAIGIYLSADLCCSYDNDVSFNSVNKFDYGIRSVGIRGSQVSFNTVTETMDGISFGNAPCCGAFHDVRITDNVVTNPTFVTTSSNGIYLQGSGSDVAYANVVAGNTVDNFGSGIGLLYVKDSGVQTNYISNVFSGIYGGWAQNQNNNYRGNIITSTVAISGPVFLPKIGLTLASSTAIFLHEEIASVITGNQIDSYDAGILIQSPSSNTSNFHTVGNDPNVVTDAHMGLQLLGNVDNSSVHGNSFTGRGDTEGVGILLDCVSLYCPDTNSFSENTITGFGTGVSLGDAQTGTGVTFNAFSRERIYGNGTGIAFYEASHNSFEESEIRDNTNDGVWQYGLYANMHNRVDRGLITGNGGYGARNLGDHILGASGNWWGFSGDAEVHDQVWSNVTSSVATGGSDTTLVDTNANFAAAGVKVGHVLVNDTDGSFAEITVVSTTPTSTLSFRRLFSGEDNTIEVGDAYHIENVDFTPWLTSGTDTAPATPGFQGDFSSQYVDADSPQLSTNMGRVEEAANWAMGSSILVFPGYYAKEDVYIYNKDLVITSTEGPGQTVLDHTGTLGATFYIEVSGLAYGGEGFHVRIGEVLEVATGTASSGSATSMTESGADFVAAGVQVGDPLENETDGSSAVITGVSADTLTFDALYGGTYDVFQGGDLFTVHGPRGFTITGPTNDGIAWGGGVEYGSSLTIEGNVINVGSGNGIAGYSMVLHDSHVVVRENQVIDNGSAGMQLGTARYLSSFTVEENFIAGNGLAGIAVGFIEEGSTLVIANNVIADNGYEGLYVDSVDSGSAVVAQGNTIGEYRDRGYDLPANGFLGLYSGINIPIIEDGSSVLIGGPAPEDGNLISGNSYYGIDAAGEGALRYNSDFTVQNNIIGGWLYNVGASTTDGSLVDDKATTMTDSTADFNALGVKLGDRLYNLTDGSWADITEVETTTLTFIAGLTGGALEPDGPGGTDDSGIDNKITYLTDSTANFVAAGVRAGHILVNLSDASSTAEITDRTANTLFFDNGLSGGIDNDVDDGDSYQVMTQNDFDHGDVYQIAFHLKGNGFGGINLYAVDYGSSITIADNVIAENGPVNGNTGISIFRVGCYVCTPSIYYADFETYGTNVVTIEDNLVGAHEYAEGESSHALVGDGGGGIRFDYINFAATVTVQNNTVAANRYNGIDMGTVGNHGTGFWSTITTGPLPQYPLYTGPEVMVLDNTVANNGWLGSYAGIYLASASYGSDVTFDGNEVTDTNGSGIYVGGQTVEHGAILRISNNDLLLNSGNGIDFASSVQNGGRLLVEGNNIAGNSFYGLYLLDISGLGTFATVTANVIGGWTDPSGVRLPGNGFDGVHISNVSLDASLTINNNTIAENGDDGIDIEYVGSDFSDVVVSDNVIGGYTDGFGNTFGGNMYNGVYVYTSVGSGERLQIGPGNTISENYNAGVYLDSFTSGVRVVGNDIADNAHGVWSDGTYNLIGHNNITGNFPVDGECCSGIHLTSYTSAVIHGNNIMGNASTTLGSYGVFNSDTEGGYADARGNYWGDPSGPLHEMDNPGGLGDSASHYVDFSDFLTSPAPVPDVTPPTVVGSAMVPGTVSWARAIFPVGPNGYDLDPAVMHFEVGPADTTAVVEAMDGGYHNGIARAWVDIAALYEAMLETVDLTDLDPLDQQALDDFLASRRMVRMNEWASSDPIWCLGISGGGSCSGDYYIDLNELWSFLYSSVFNIEDDEAQQAARNIDRGKFDVPITLEDWSGNISTVTTTLETVDMQVPLFEGWNARSTPVELEGGMWNADWISDPNVVDAILKYDVDAQAWVVVTDTILEPLEGVYIHMLDKERMGLTWGKTSAPSRDLRQGWNLIGLAAYDYQAPVASTLGSIALAPGNLNGWTVLAAFGEDFDYNEDYVYEGRDFQDYQNWYYNHSSWIDTPSGSQTMYVGSTYWVAMDNDDELVGFSLPPVTFQLAP